MDEDDPWAEYARIQALANSPHLSRQVRAAEDALNAILDRIEDGQQVSARQADNFLKNRSRTQRERRKLLTKHADLLGNVAANENHRFEARSELGWHHRRCNGREWRVLVGIGIGHTYASIAEAERVPEATVKTWVRRIRIKLAA